MSSAEAADAGEAPTAPQWEVEADTQALAVSVGVVEFGLPVREVREIVRVPPITRLPRPLPAVRGIASIRGAIVPVVDLAARLLGREVSVETGRMVIVWDARHEGQVGLLVDGVADLISTSGARLDPPPEVQATLPAGWISAVVSPAPGRLVTLLSLGPVLDLSESSLKERR